MEKEYQQQSTVNSQNTEDDLKILLRMLSIYYQSLIPSYIFVTKRLMSGQRLTQSEYALQRVIELFSVLLTQLDEARLTHTYREVFRFCQLENIDYLVLRYLNTGAQPFEEWAEE
jgi:hypothetical protein